MNATTPTMRQRRRARKAPPPNESRFNAETFEQMADDLKTQRIPLRKVFLSDDVQPGLSVIIRDSGSISFHAQYEFGGDRPQMKIGNHPDMSINDARKIVKAIKALGHKGVDVQDGLHDRLVRELMRDGENWRPTLSEPPARSRK